MRAAGRRELVVLGFAAGLGDPPLFGEEPFALEAVERGIERAFLDDDVVRRRLANPAADGVAVARPPADRLEDQDVERAREQIGTGHARRSGSKTLFTEVYARGIPMSIRYWQEGGRS